MLHEPDVTSCGPIRYFESWCSRSWRVLLFYCFFNRFFPDFLRRSKDNFAIDTDLASTPRQRSAWTRSLRLCSSNNWTPSTITLPATPYRYLGALRRCPPGSVASGRSSYDRGVGHLWSVLLLPDTFLRVVLLSERVLDQLDFLSCFLLCLCWCALGRSRFRCFRQVLCFPSQRGGWGI